MARGVSGRHHGDPRAGDTRRGTRDQYRPSPEEILRYLAENPDRSGKREIAKAFGLRGEDRVWLKDVLRDLLGRHAPCVVLIDELVAYIRQFPESQAISGGSYDSNLSFVQALTEAVKLVPRAFVLASLPESDLEAGSQRGVASLRALEKTFGRVQALWKPVATEEAFEIVRRRLFEPVRDEKTREAVCRAFADAYIAEGVKLPADTQERRYFERLLHAYPIHPEVFDRLYEDWTTIDGFQRTRGVLKLMAKVIYRLWKDDNKDLLIMPGSLPLHDSSSRNELTYYLPAGWDAVIERDMEIASLAPSTVNFHLGAAREARGRRGAPAGARAPAQRSTWTSAARNPWVRAFIAFSDSASLESTCSRPQPGHLCSGNWTTTLNSSAFLKLATSSRSIVPVGSARSSASQALQW